MLKVAVREPVPVGAKMRWKVQLCEAARFAPQDCEVMEKSLALVPVMEAPEMPMVDEPLFVSVTSLLPLLDPTAKLAKDRLEGLAVALPAVELVPTPESETPWGLLEALSVKLREAVRVPVPVGAKATFTVQLVLGARLAPQVVES